MDLIQRTFRKGRKKVKVGSPALFRFRSCVFPPKRRSFWGKESLIG